MVWESACAPCSWYPLHKSGKYFPNEIMIGHAAARQSKRKIKICDQLEKPIERLKVAKVWHQTALCTVCISISWILCLPLGSVDACSNMRHMQTLTCKCTIIKKQTFRNAACCGVAHTNTWLNQHTLIPKAGKVIPMLAANFSCKFIKWIKLLLWLENVFFVSVFVVLLMAPFIDSVVEDSNCVFVVYPTTNTVD